MKVLYLLVQVLLIVAIAVVIGVCVFGLGMIARTLVA